MSLRNVGNNLRGATSRKSGIVYNTAVTNFVNWYAAVLADVKKLGRIQWNFAALFYSLFAYAHCSYANAL